MREIEIKAHVFDVDRIKLLIESFAGKAGLVDKKDTYLKNEKGKLMRIRINKMKMAMRIILSMRYRSDHLLKRL